MLKISFSTLPCEGWSIEKLIDNCQKYGYTGIELREGQGYSVSISTPTEERLRMNQLFQEAGITVTDIASSVCIKGTSVQEIQKCFDELRANICLASSLSAKGVRIFLGNFYAREISSKQDFNYEKIVEFIKNACVFAATHNIEIWIETHNEFSTGKILKKLLEDVGAKNCKVIWDILHSVEDGETPEETLNLLGDKCVHVHIKDAAPFEDLALHDWRYTLLGQGNVPVKDIVGMLLKKQYKGYFSLEWESKWRDELKTPEAAAELVLPVYVDYMKNIINEYYK